MAREAGIPVAEKPDSQEICFIPDQDYAGFIEDVYKRQESSCQISELLTGKDR